MPKPFLLDHPHCMCLTLPESLWTRLTLLLYSPMEKRVPHGAYKEYFTRLVEDDLSKHKEP